MVLKTLLEEALAREGWHLPGGAVEGLVRYSHEMLRWNQRINLTALTQPAEVVEKHLVDSLHLLPLLRGSRRLLDLGSGAGFPGAILAMAMPELEVCLVEASAKKAAFLQHAALCCGLHPRVQVRPLFARGQAQEERLEGFDTVVSRALMEVGAFVPLAKAYLQPGGKVLAMLGKADEGQRPGLESLATTQGCHLAEFHCFHLKPSGHERALACFKVL
ncbi:MAG: 16S rRNA (guanine(527)-N(7))-methyltransferase RsmG [Proteobacteria bacterium]|nr:16S rRNA (guanine(527)-N(7))-methyltransferase RsmG [Cystobacterineae bacterium]MCL2258953.1 16S rRNA (guanine(527)-N(7))-methyltransferase RsmG [Cystobacterineae bacterium]MCL2314889.1 16S rRNA (guanine(527)-N(7))-methyltransferase RsmG [Pseudomonadota bacterium]